MRKHAPLAIVAVLLPVLAVLGSVTGASSNHPHSAPPPPHPPAAGVFDPSAPGPPVGWNTVQYSHDFTTQGNTGWTVQPGAGATVSNSKSFGMGIEMTQTNQWAEAILGNNTNYFLGPNEFIEALVYIPAGSGTNGEGDTFPAGSTANWPAFWTTGNPWPNNGEIDALEGQEGRSCEQTHYGTSGEINSVSNCGALGADSTGWLTLSILRENEHVYEWYSHGSTVIPVGTVPLPTTADEELIFQNQSYSTSVCAHCFGPTVLGANSTAWLSRVEVWTN